MAFESVTYAAAKGTAKSYTDSVISSIGKGMEYKGSVPTMADLPTNPTKGWLYTITANGHEVVYDGTQWVDLNDGDGEIFNAVYNETSFDDILTAYNAGKIVQCLGNGTCLRLAMISSDSPKTAFFTSLYRMDGTIAFTFITASKEDNTTTWDGNIQTIAGNIEDTYNKVTSWSSSLTDTHYPTEKLVKNSLDELDLTLKAVYGETSFDDIKNAFTNGKNVYCIVDDDTYPITFVGSNLAIFENCNIEDGVVKIKRVTSDLDEGWKVLDSIELEITSNKVTTITSESTDTQYPTAKAVYNLFNQLQQQINNLSN